MYNYNNINDFWLSLGRNNKIQSHILHKIYSLDLTLTDINSLNKNKLLSVFITSKVADMIIDTLNNTELERIHLELGKNSIKYVFIFEDNYPEILKEISSPPFILYYKGDISILNETPAIGVVGSRRPSEYGKRITEDIVAQVARYNVTIVSGMAIGIDTIAHMSALEAGGRTVAVLGCGLDQIYPSSNLDLSKSIINKGAIISEYPFGTPPLKHHFPARNRIISGLSKGLLVTEAAARSGSLITANFAVEQNRDVFAIPGNIYNLNSSGPNNLIQSGAMMVTKAQDILDELGIFVKLPGTQAAIAPANQTEEAIINVLNTEPLHIDSITKATGLAGHIVCSALTIMEITGKAKHLGGMVYRINI